ncbi:hypothetical protein E3O25_11640 [Cryobacterium sp. TMT1-3]|uniref:Sporulation protein n=1 Tax=Cryobacterium luteum TaxID=1424661 RepID=A0A1H8ERP6_9MICO|nr:MULTISPECIES: hypothetical protein [Cryobacterium]TFB85388.1 hypothetical protein E3O10_14695 [Cryobacterium luteum]TFC26709.1 hypothetical protein E3O25_11640 [Cryobacterium sp. TMT1-3]SEN22251.1 hypothetical protein SAMN05216281_10549 [Cryobacterium luteum]
MTSLPEKLADTFRSAGVKSAYGDPVQIDGVTLVPVALSYYGFGGGDAGEGGAGSGGGGGGVSLPIGAYVKSGGTARFEPNVIALLAVGVPFLIVAGRALARVIKALKK